jgi:hypothetical protein
MLILLNAASSRSPSVRLDCGTAEGAIPLRFHLGIRIHGVSTSSTFFSPTAQCSFTLLCNALQPPVYPRLTTPSRTMALKWNYLICAATCLILARAQGKDDFKERCLSFTPEMSVHNSTRTVLEYVPGGTTLAFPDNDASCARPSQLVSMDMCRVALSIPTSNRYSGDLISIWKEQE